MGSTEAARKEDKKPKLGDMSLDDAEFEAMLKEEAMKFEESLRDIFDPLERAKARFRFYPKQTQLRLQRERSLGTSDRGGNVQQKKGQRTIRNRKFASYDQRYTGTLLNEELKEVEKEMSRKQALARGKKPQQSPGYPVFLGEDGTLYDITYSPIADVDELKKNYKRGKFTTLFPSRPQVSESESDWDKYQFSNDPVLYESMPDPNNFDSFDDYEQALLSWKSDVDKSLGYLQLPRVMGRQYYRPYFNPNNNKQQDEEEGIPEAEDDYGYFGRVLDRESSWEACLVPLEPKPQFYKTFEEYEKALTRWFVVTAGLRFIPPHPAQLEHLIGIKKVKKPLHPVQEDLEASKNKELDEDLVGGKDDSSLQIDEKNKVQQVWDLRNEWETILTESDRQLVRGVIEKLLLSKMESKEIFGAFHRTHRPRIHGIIDTHGKLVRRLSLSEFRLQVGHEKKDSIPNVAEWIQVMRQERSLSTVFASSTMPYYQAIAEDLTHQIPVRRLDLSEEEIKKSWDCEEYQQGRKVVFKVPDFDIGQIEFPLLANETYIRFLQVLLARIDNHHRFDNLNSWYYPKLSTQVTKEQQQELCRIFATVSHPSQVTPEMLRNIFTTSALLDVFSIWLDSSLKAPIALTADDGEVVNLNKYSDLCFAVMNAQNLRQTLRLFHETNSQLVHSKVGSFILEFMKQRRSAPLFEAMITENDIDSLYFVAQAVSFYDEIPTQLFEYTPELQSLIRQMFADGIHEFFKLVMQVYYMVCIAISLIEETKSFPDVYTLLLERIETDIKSVADYLQKNERFLSEYLWILIRSRNKNFSQLGQFLLSMMFVLSFKPEIQQLMRSTSTNLVGNIRTMALSKFSHVQKAVARILPQLNEKRAWRLLLLQTYSNVENVIQDVINAPSGRTLNSQPPLISSLVMEFLAKTLSLGTKPTSVADDEDMMNSINNNNNNILNNDFSPPPMQDQAQADDSEEEQQDTMQMVFEWLEMKCFNLVLGRVLETFHQYRIDQSSVMGAKFLEIFCKYVTGRGLVEVIKSDKNKTTVFRLPRPGGGRSASSAAGSDANNFPKLQVSYTDIQGMLDFSNQPKRSRRDYLACTHMLRALAELLKCPAVFDLLRKDNNDFFSKLVLMCNDGNDMDFNRAAWRTFYQVIKFNAGVIDMLTSKTNNQMSSFVEMIGGCLTLHAGTSTVKQLGKSDSVVTTNSIHYFNKVFKLPRYSPKLHLRTASGYAGGSGAASGGVGGGVGGVGSGLASGGGLGGGGLGGDFGVKQYAAVPSEEVRKQYESSVERLMKYIVSKNLFNTVHKTYMRLQGHHSGWPFQNIVNLYSTISDRQTLMKSIEKNAEHKQGFAQVKQLQG